MKITVNKYDESFNGRKFGAIRYFPKSTYASDSDSLDTSALSTDVVKVVKQSDHWLFIVSFINSTYLFMTYTLFSPGSTATVFALHG